MSKEKCEINYISHDGYILDLAQKSKIMIDEILNGAVDNNHFKSIFTVRYKGIVDRFNNNHCDGCDACDDIDFYIKVIDCFLNNYINKNQLRECMNEWINLSYTYKAVENIKEKSIYNFNRAPVNVKGDLYYLDHNVFSKAANQPKLLDSLVKIKKHQKVSFPYSPAHAEEIVKIELIEEREKILKIFDVLSSELSIQISTDDGPSRLFNEPISIVIERCESTRTASIYVENKKVLKNDERDMLFKEYNENKHRIILGQITNIFDTLSDENFCELVNARSCPPGGGNKADFKKLVLEDDIRNAIYSLHDAMDFLGYKHDSNERTQRSSVYDIEHLIYATKCRFFITEDKKLLCRAKEIYNFMEVETEVLSLKELMEKVDI